MTLFEALYESAIARIENERKNLAGPVLSGSMNDHAEYKQQTGVIEGLRQAQAILTQERKRLLEPQRSDKPKET